MQKVNIDEHLSNLWKFVFQLKRIYKILTNNNYGNIDWVSKSTKNIDRKQGPTKLRFSKCFFKSKVQTMSSYFYVFVSPLRMAIQFWKWNLKCFNKNSKNLKWEISINDLSLHLIPPFKYYIIFKPFWIEIFILTCSLWVCLFVCQHFANFRMQIEANYMKIVEWFHAGSMKVFFLILPSQRMNCEK